MQDCKIARHTTKSTKSTKLKIKYTLYSTVNPDTDKRTKPIFNLDKEALYNYNINIYIIIYILIL